MTIYTQLKFSRSDGRSWTTGLTGYGESSVEEAREMARNLSKALATDFIEVIIEDRVGAESFNGKTYNWSRNKGWH